MDYDIPLATAMGRFCPGWSAFKTANMKLQKHGVKEQWLALDPSRVRSTHEQGKMAVGVELRKAAAKRFDLAGVILIELSAQMRNGILIASGRRQNQTTGVGERHQIPCDYWVQIPAIDLLASRVVFPSGETFESVSVTEPLLCKSAMVLHDALYGKKTGIFN